MADEPVALRLSVAGRSRRSIDAERRARALIERYGPHGATLEVIDVFEVPAEAEEARILATPTLVRLSPGPAARVIGELDDLDLLATLLDLPQPNDREPTT